MLETIPPPFIIDRIRRDRNKKHPPLNDREQPTVDLDEELPTEVIKEDPTEEEWSDVYDDTIS